MPFVVVLEATAFVSRVATPDHRHSMFLFPLFEAQGRLDTEWNCSSLPLDPDAKLEPEDRDEELLDTVVFVLDEVDVRDVSESESKTPLSCCSALGVLRHCAKSLANGLLADFRDKTGALLDIKSWCRL